MVMKIDTTQIQRARVVRGWSKTRLASAAGIAPSTVGRIESGKFMKPETVKRLVDVLGLRMEDIVQPEGRAS